MKDLIVSKRHSSKWVGIFISCFHYPDLANWLKQRVLKLMLKQKLKYFDKTYWLDEYFVSNTNNKNKFWLPDISKSFNISVNNDDAEFELLCPQIDNFLINNKGKDILLFLGAEFNRKGLDFIIELALEDEQFVVLRAGDPLENADKSQEIMEKMSMLEKTGRLLNIPKFIKNPIIISKLFQATNYILLPYRDHYSSSGVMLQAIEFQKPVVVPNIGLMGKRVVENHIGITYKHKKSGI
jgi:glycosyltransferase involved in cell wall biosynthesis